MPTHDTRFQAQLLRRASPSAAGGRTLNLNRFFFCPSHVTIEMKMNMTYSFIPIVHFSRQLLHTAGASLLHSSGIWDLNLPSGLPVWNLCGFSPRNPASSIPPRTLFQIRAIEKKKGRIGLSHRFCLTLVRSAALVQLQRCQCER